MSDKIMYFYPNGDHGTMTPCRSGTIEAIEQGGRICLRISFKRSTASSLRAAVAYYTSSDYLEKGFLYAVENMDTQWPDTWETPWLSRLDFMQVLRLLIENQLRPNKVIPKPKPKRLEEAETLIKRIARIVPELSQEKASYQLSRVIEDCRSYILQEVKLDPVLAAKSRDANYPLVSKFGLSDDF